MSDLNPHPEQEAPTTNEAAETQAAQPTVAPQEKPQPVLRNPPVLTLPDWKGAPASHWLTQWEHQHGLRRVNQHDWQRPLRGDWMMQLQEAVLTHEQCHLLAHGLAAHLVDAWLKHTQQARRVLSVTLVDPIDLQGEELRETLFTWKPQVRQPWHLPVAVLWKERQPTPELQALLDTWGVQPLNDGTPVGGGVVGGWALLPTYWTQHEQTADHAAKG